MLISSCVTGGWLLIPEMENPAQCFYSHWDNNADALRDDHFFPRKPWMGALGRKGVLPQSEPEQWEHPESSLGDTDVFRTEAPQELGSCKQKPLAGPDQPGWESSAGQRELRLPLCLQQLLRTRAEGVPGWSCRGVLGALGRRWWHQACSWCAPCSWHRFTAAGSRFHFQAFPGHEHPQG